MLWYAGNANAMMYVSIYWIRGKFGVWQTMFLSPSLCQLSIVFSIQKTHSLARAFSSSTWVITSWSFRESDMPIIWIWSWIIERLLIEVCTRLWMLPKTFLFQVLSWFLRIWSFWERKYIGNPTISWVHMLLMKALHCPCIVHILRNSKIRLEIYRIEPGFHKKRKMVKS